MFNSDKSRVLKICFNSILVKLFVLFQYINHVLRTCFISILITIFNSDIKEGTYSNSILVTLLVLLV